MPPNDEETLEQVRAELDEMRQLNTEFKQNMAAFNSEITKKREKENKERVSGIVELAVKAGKEKDYNQESLSAMSPETLTIIENSLNDLIAEQAKNSNPDDGSGSFNPNRGQETGLHEMTAYDRVDKLADIVALSFGLPIPSDEIKEEVRFEHMAADNPLDY